MRHFIGIWVLMLLLLGGCIEYPTFEEVFDKSAEDLRGFTRHVAQTLDEEQNRIALSDFNRHFKRLDSSCQREVKDDDDFFDRDFSKTLEHILIEFDDAASDMFAETAAVGDAGNGKRFEYTAAQLCTLIYRNVECGSEELKRNVFVLELTSAKQEAKVVSWLLGEDDSFLYFKGSKKRALFKSDLSALYHTYKSYYKKLGLDSFFLSQLSGSLQMELRKRSGIELSVDVEDFYAERSSLEEGFEGNDWRVISAASIVLDGSLAGGILELKIELRDFSFDFVRTGSRRIYHVDPFSVDISVHKEGGKPTEIVVKRVAQNNQADGIALSVDHDAFMSS